MEENQIPLNTHRKHPKIRLLFVVAILICLTMCFLSIIFLWYGGFIKEFVCKSVRSESIIWNKFSCSSTITGQDSNQFPLAVADPNSATSTSEDANIESIVSTSSPSVIGIGILGDNVNSLDQIIGTGFVISKAGLIVTNRHVVEAEDVKYYVVFNDVKTTLDILPENIFRDPVNDIALIKIDNAKIPSNVKALPLGDSDALKLGQTVIAIGNPLGKYSGTVTKGIVSGLNREVTITKGFFSSQNEIYSDVIQTDAAINPGNSGGPMINTKGEVIGINFATVEGASNLSFALPINRIKSRISELEQNGKFKIPYLGVEYQTKVIFVKGQSLLGAEIMNVVKGSPAEASGLKVGDIIVDFNGSSLDNSALLSLIQKTTIGSKVQVTIIRNKVEQTIEVVIGEK